MSEKFVVVQGATCICSFGNAPDSLVVNSHQKEYANDADGNEKPIVTTCERGSSTLKNNSFGSCRKLGSPPPPCKVNITEWKNYYEDVTLSNGGKIITHDSRAICAIAGIPCISITWHGQITEISTHNLKNADPVLQRQINPLVDIQELTEEETHYGLEINGEVLGNP